MSHEHEHEHQHEHEQKHREYGEQQTQDASRKRSSLADVPSIFLLLCISNHEIESALVQKGVKIADFLHDQLGGRSSGSPGSAESALQLYSYYFRRGAMPEWFSDLVKDIPEAEKPEPI